MRRMLGVMLVLGAGSACRGSTTGPDSSLVVVDGRTASFQGTDLTLLTFNLSWYPRDDSPMPASGDAFVTIEVEFTNRSDAPRTISRQDLVLSTLDDGPDLHAGPRWHSSAEGRSPGIAERILHPGESVSGWITYSVPIEELAEDVLWSPAEDLEFAIEIPWWGPERVAEARIFGTVRDANGSPLAGVPLTVSPLETVPGIPGAEATVGECTGTPKSVLDAVTDPSGTYELVAHWIHVTELCIDVHAATDPSHRAAGLVRPGGRGELAEVPELRIDLVIGVDVQEPDPIACAVHPPSLLVDVVDEAGRAAAAGATLTVTNARFIGGSEGYVDSLTIPAWTSEQDERFDISVTKPWHEEFQAKDILVPTTCGGGEPVRISATLPLLPDAPAVRQVVLPPYDFRIARSLCGMPREIDGYVFAGEHVSRGIIWQSRNPELLTVVPQAEVAEGHHRAGLIPPCSVSAAATTFVVGISEADPSVRDSIEVEIY